MPSRLEILVDGDELLGIRDESIALEQVADGGEIGSGGFDREDDSLSDVPALKDVTVEDSRADTPRLFTGMTGDRSIARGKEKRDTNRDWDVTLWDTNALLEGIVLESSDANRPAETDYARVTWLLTKLAALGISAGVVPNTHTVNLDAEDYRKTADGPRRVLSDCAEASQKNYFLYDYGAGAKLYYDQHQGTSLTSSVKISTDPADWDGSTVFPILQGATKSKDPSEIWSKVIYKYQGGSVTRTDSDAGVTTSTDFRQRETVVEDANVKSLTKATAKADAYLVAASTETERIRCSVEVTAEAAGEIQAGMRIHTKIAHLDVPAFAYFRITRRVLQLAEASSGRSRELYRLDLEFATEVKLTSFNDSRQGSNDETADVDDGSAVALTRYQLEEELGSGYFGPAAGLWTNVAPSFAFGSISAAVDGIVDKTPEGNIPWPYTDCGVGTGGVAGLAIRSVWHRFQVDLDDETLVGIRVTVAAFLATGSGFTASPGGFLVGDDTVVVGIHRGASSTGTEITAHDDFVEVGRVGSAGGEVFIPRSLLIDNSAGYGWIVLAPGWEISNGLFFCNSAGNKPWGYGKTGHDSNGSSIVSAVEVNAGGSGLSGWLPADGDIDGSNKDFVLPLWNGEGMPVVRVGAIELETGEYSVDSSTLTATLVSAPVEPAAGVSYRARIG